MGMKHEAKKGTVIEVNGVTIKVLRGSPLLEITDQNGNGIVVLHPESDEIEAAGRLPMNGSQRRPALGQQ